MHKKTHVTVSYPRLLIENHLGRYLDKNEDVHHRDGDKSNNNITNLEVVNHSKHVSQHNRENSKKYYDVFKKCPICGITFQWTDKQQRNFYKKLNRTKHKNKSISKEPFCSKRCTGIYGTRLQAKYKTCDIDIYK